MQNLKSRPSVKPILKEARDKKNWTLDSKEPLRRASKLLDPNWKEEDYFYPGVSHESWNFFLYGTRKIKVDIFKAYCQVLELELEWKEVAELTEIQETDLPVVSPEKAHPSIPNQNFVGRQGAIARLNTHINQGAKIIVIQAAGGVGKTKLAEEYFNSQGFELVIHLPMAKEKENIQLVESVIEGWLKQDFEEEPGREFWEMLRRLKRQLQTRKIGVLIDNLEPALDGQG
jgi:hypothetical protein